MEILFFPSKTYIIHQFWHICNHLSSNKLFAKTYQHAIIFYQKNWTSIFGFPLISGYADACVRTGSCVVMVPRFSFALQIKQEIWIHSAFAVRENNWPSGKGSALSATIKSLRFSEQTGKFYCTVALAIRLNKGMCIGELPLLCCQNSARSSIQQTVFQEQRDLWFTPPPTDVTPPPRGAWQWWQRSTLAFLTKSLVLDFPCLLIAPVSTFSWVGLFRVCSGRRGQKSRKKSRNFFAKK